MCWLPIPESASPPYFHFTHLPLLTTWPFPTWLPHRPENAPKEFPKMPQKSTRHVDTYKKSCKTDLSKALNTSPLFALRVKGEINLCSFFCSHRMCPLLHRPYRKINYFIHLYKMNVHQLTWNISLTLLISIRETKKYRKTDNNL